MARYYEDLVLGEVVRSSAVALSERGVVTYRYELIEEDGDTITSFISTSLIKTRNIQIPIRT